MYQLLLILFVFFSCISTSCISNFEKGIKSTNINFILMVINDLSNKKEYEDVILLYKKLIPLVYKTNLLSYVEYKLAETNFKLNNYFLSAYQFKKIYNKLPKSKKSENILYLCAVSCYKDSKSFNLDSKETIIAINEIQNFINLYPNSEKLFHCNTMIKNLYEKIENKAYYDAVFFLKINKYESAILAFSNMILDFPDSKMREEAYYYIIFSKYNLIRKLIHISKKEKIFDIKKSIEFFLEEFPNSIFKDKIYQIKIKINNLLLNNKQ